MTGKSHAHFVHTVQIALRHTDAAGIVFYPRYFELMQDAAEAFLSSRGLPPSRVLQETPYFLPIVHAECDFRAPLRWGDTVRVEVTVVEVRRRSFTLAYRFVNPDGRVGAEGRVSQVSADRHTQKAIPLPAELRHALDAPHVTVSHQ
jgi:YbgC/YbaW family acyl-CoA thioester hydrolase